MVFHISICGGLELCLGGAKPTKVPRGDGTMAHPGHPLELLLGQIYQ